MENKHIFFASCPRNCASLLEKELLDLGLEILETSRGGVSFTSDIMSACKACLWSRIANRIMLKLKDFQAFNADALYKRSMDIPWEDHISSLNSFAMQGLGTSEVFNHSGFLALKVKDALVDRMRKTVGRRPKVDKHEPDIRVVVHNQKNHITVYLDLSGESLHRRGWRIKSGEAPIKENLASAIIYLSGYDGSETLVDPMCGSGTFLIEAAEIAMGLGAGRNRDFGFERWPNFSKKMRAEFNRARDEAKIVKNSEIEPIFGFDIDKETIRNTSKNVDRVGFGDYITLDTSNALDVEPPSEKCTFISNLPYGERIDITEESLIELYKDLGLKMRDYEDAHLALLCSHELFRKSFMLKPSSITDLMNGGIEVRLFQYDVGNRFPFKKFGK